MKKTNNKVEFNSNGLFINGKRKDLYSANFDFWRHNILYWDRIMQEIKNLGFNIVCTYLQWDLFQLVDGTYDFIGRTNDSRNFMYFIESCKKYKLDLILRPGPYIMAELETWGVPQKFARMDRLEPDFLKNVFDWLSAVNEIVVPFQKTYGGPIILYQVDNEVIFPHSLELDNPGKTQVIEGNNAYSYRRDFVFEKFDNWFKSVKDIRYKDIRADCRQIEEVIQNKDFYFPKLSNKAKNIIFDFMSSYMYEYFEKYIDFIRKQGINIPVTANVGTLMVHDDWKSMLKIINTIGIDIYFPNLLPGNQYYTLEWSIKLAKALFTYAWSPEFQCGIWYGNEDTFGMITPQHSKFINEASLALGLWGYNFYTFVERDDWYYSPINPIGKVRSDRAEMYKNFGRILHEVASTTLMSDLGIIWSLEDHRLFMTSKYNDWTYLINYAYEFGLPRENAKWWKIFRLLIEKDVDFEIIDLRDVSACTKKALILVDFGDSDTTYKQNKADFNKYVTNGGKLFIVNFSNKQLKEMSIKSENMDNKQYYFNNSHELLKLLGNNITLYFVKTNKNKLRSSLYIHEDSKRLFLFIINYSDRKIEYKIFFNKNQNTTLSNYLFAVFGKNDSQENFNDFTKKEKSINAKSVKIFEITKG